MNCRIQNVIVALSFVFLFAGADWLQFRGSDGTGVSKDNAVPVTWSVSENIAWKIPLEGRGVSGPIVIGDRVVVTSSSGFRQDKLHVKCFDVSSGDVLWQRQFWATGRTMCHPKMCVATSTPASDGKRIFAFYSSNDVACLDLDGNLLWYRGLGRDFPNASNSLGMASSPIVVDDTLVVQVENDADSFATGLNVETGVARWKIPRTKRANWTTPSILRDQSGNTNLVLLQSSAGVAAIHPRTGKVFWSYDDGASTIPSLVVSGDVAYVPSNGLTAIKSSLDGKTSTTLWRQGKLGPGTCSPIIDGDRVYSVNGAGVLNCADIGTGEIAWRVRLKPPISSSPVAAGGHIYFFNEKGLAQVVRAGRDKGEVVSEFDHQETFLCTPAIADGALYIRSDKHLWKIARQPSQ